MNYKNYYHLLGLQSSATSDEIKTAYRKLSFKFHPDRNIGDPFMEEMFKQINEAHEVLSDSTRRRAYDTSTHLSDQVNNRTTFQYKSPTNPNAVSALQVKIETYFDLEMVTQSKKNAYNFAAYSPRPRHITIGKVACCFFIMLIAFIMGKPGGLEAADTSRPAYQWTTTQNVTIYSKPNFHSSKVYELPSGVEFDAIKETKYFLHVEIKDSVGYIYRGYLLKHLVSHSR